MLPNDVLSLGAPASSPASASRLAPVARSLLLLLAAGCGSAPHASDQAPIGEWRHYAADRASTKYSPLDQIDPSNVDQLREVWRWTSVETEADTEHRGGMYKSTPLYIDGVLYITTSLSQVAAIDPGTGETLWVYDPRSYDAGRPANAGFQQRGLEYWSGEIDGEAVERLIYAAHHRRLISLDRLTGEPDPAFGDGGMVNTAVGLGREINERQYTHSAPPIVCADVIVLGSIVSDGPRGPKMPPGHVRGYDARTGEQRWIFHTIPRPGEFGNETWLDGSWEYSGNTNVWTMMSCDDELGFVYLPVSTPTNDWYGGHRRGDNLFAESLVAVDARSGERKWHFQAVRHGLWDYDLASAPNLVDVTVDGRRIKAVAQVSKQGITYVFDRETGEPVWPIEDVVILHQLGGPATAQQVPAPAPGQVVVLGADGQPAGEASVTVLLPGRGGVSPADEILVRSGTADNGVVANAVPRLHGLTLVVDHPTHLPFVGQYPNQPPPSEIRLQAGRTAKGVVREAAGGATVSGAAVCVAWSDEGLPDWFGTLRRCAESGVRGTFELAGLPAGTVRATAEAPGFDTDSQAIEQGRRASRVVFELVARGESAAEAATAPAGAGEVRVELVGAAGEPIRNFTMRTNAVGRMGGASHDVEDAEGPVLVPISPSFGVDTTVDLSFRAENYLESSLIRVAPIPGGEIELGLIALDSGAVVQGRLFDAVGAEPAVGCLVELLPPGAGAVAALMLRQRHVTVSDPEGGYMLGGLRAGRYHLRLQCPEVPVTDRLIVLGANELADQGESWLDSGRPVAVQVVGVDGGTVRLLDRFREVEAPIVQAALQVPAEAETSQRGGEDSRVRAEFEAAPDVYRLEVLDASGRLRVSQEVLVEEGPAEVQTIGVAIATRVIQSILVMDGRPVTGGHVSFSRVFEPSRSSGKLQIVSQRPGGSRQQRVLGIPPQAVGGAVGPDGAFEVAGAPTDLLWMTWRAEGGNVGRLWPEGSLPRMDLNGVRVTGELLDVNGAPIGGQVSLIGDVGRTVAYAEAGDDGRFELPPAPPGSYRLKASAGVSPTRVREGRSSRAGNVFQDLALGTEPPSHVVLRVQDAETGVLEVELQRADGSPAAGAWLHFVNASGDMVNTSLASAAGQASRNLPAGDTSLVWNDGAACTGGLGVNVEAGSTATARESLPIGRLLELRCPASDCAGEALSFLSVTTESGAEIASHLTGAREAVRFSDSGWLGLGCVTPGAYEVSFWAAGRRWGAEVDVGSQGNLEEPVVVNGRVAGL